MNNFFTCQVKRSQVEILGTWLEYLPSIRMFVPSFTYIWHEYNYSWHKVLMARIKLLVIRDTHGSFHTLKQIFKALKFRKDSKNAKIFINCIILSPPTNLFEKYDCGLILLLPGTLITVHRHYFIILRTAKSYFLPPVSELGPENLVIFPSFTWDRFLVPKLVIIQWPNKKWVWPQNSLRLAYAEKPVHRYHCTLTKYRLWKHCN